MDKEELAILAGKGAHAEMTRRGEEFVREHLTEAGVKTLSEEEWTLLECGIAAGIVAATNWFTEHGMLKDLEVKNA